MSRKRKCRMTPAELALHQEAIRLRRLTDKQLVEQFHRAASSTPLSKPQMGQNGPDTSGQENTQPSLQRLLITLPKRKCKDVKGATVYKITQFAMEMGLL